MIDILYPVRYAAGIAAELGSVYGLTRGRQKPPTALGTQGQDQWTDWQNMVVFRTVQQRAEITSFYLLLVPSGQWNPPKF